MQGREMKFTKQQLQQIIGTHQHQHEKSKHRHITEKTNIPRIIIHIRNTVDVHKQRHKT